MRFFEERGRGGRLFVSKRFGGAVGPVCFCGEGLKDTGNRLPLIVFFIVDLT